MKLLHQKFKLGKDIADLNELQMQKYQISKNKMNKQQCKNYAAKKLKICGVNWENLLYTEKHNEKQTQKIGCK